MSTAVDTTALKAATWVIDPVHSQVGFSVRHLMVSKVKGTFDKFEGSISITDDPLQSLVTATIEVTSINTANSDRDGHLRTADFLEAEKYPNMTFRSTAVHAKGDDFVVDGELTLHGVTKNIELSLEFNGVSPDPWGGTRAGFSAETEINRKDFGINLDLPLEGGGVVVGDKVKITLEVEATLQV
jgi:polyisoprenoid-binding protein YceI